MSDVDNDQKIKKRQATTVPKEKNNKKNLIFYIVTCLVFIGIITLLTFEVKKVISDMYNTYINNTREIIFSKENIETANNWERLPLNEKKERLRKRYYEIIKYYTINIPDNQKMNDEQIINTFNSYFDCINAVRTVNFFLPLAYIKAMTNFNPNYSEHYQYGLGWFYEKEGATFSNLQLVRSSEIFNVAYKGRISLQNPYEAIRLVVARMDDLMKTFDNREDWIILSMLQNEYIVIDKYWENGEGKIPDSFYKDGKLKEILNYYYAFKNWQIIPNDIK